MVSGTEYARRLVVGLAVAVGLLLAACGDGQPVVRVSMGEFTFEPNHWTVPAGAEVTVDLKNRGVLEHEWMVMESGYTATVPFDDDDRPHVLWQARLDRDTQDTLRFTAPAAPGDYQIVCSIPGHLQAGMQGVLTVTE